MVVHSVASEELPGAPAMMEARVAKAVLLGLRELLEAAATALGVEVHSERHGSISASRNDARCCQRPRSRCRLAARDRLGRSRRSVSRHR